MTPKISIIIPVYNTAQYLPQCLQSVLQQTCKELEIICIDNNSSDNSWQVLQSFAAQDPRIRLGREPSPGQSAARNAGLAMARGEYVGFLDSDDWIDARYYEKLLCTAEQTGADIVYSKMLHAPAADTVIYGSAELITRWPERLESSSCCDKLYRHDFLLKHQLQFAPGRTWEDVLWVLQCMCLAEKVVCLPSNAYFYRINPDGTVQQGLSARLQKTAQDTLFIMRQGFDYIQNSRLSPQQKKSARCYLVFKLFQIKAAEQYPWYARETKRCMGLRLYWKVRLGLPLDAHAPIAVSIREFHGRDYYVLHILGAKIRLWKTRPNARRARY